MSAHATLPGSKPVRWPVGGVLAALALVALTLAGCVDDEGDAPAGKPTPNPYLSSSGHGVTHFDSSQSDSTPHGPPKGVYHVDPSNQPIVHGGPIGIMTMDAADPDYMWQMSADRVGYILKSAGKWEAVATFQALAEASSGALPAIPDADFRTFGEASAAGTTPAAMDAWLASLFGANYRSRFGNGTYGLVDKDNVAYANYLDTIFAFALVDPHTPAAGIKILHRLDGAVSKLQAGHPPPPAGARLSGLSMTYDGRLLVTFSNGVAVIDRALNPDTRAFYRFPDDEYVSNSCAVDERNGIYVASGPSFTAAVTTPKSVMRKLVWTGSALSDRASDGAWSAPYDDSHPELPPLIKIGHGTGSTPTLMGFGPETDRLVVITDGARRMKLVAFWRDDIPDWFVQKPGTASRRVADQIPVTCGFAVPPAWLQSEQSVVVSGHGAFVVNNLPKAYSAELQAASKLVQVALMGPASEPPHGVERFRWNPSSHAWSSVWSRADVSSTSMIPVHCDRGNMAVIGGYRPQSGWETLGLDWDSGEIVHQTIFGPSNFGNGSYAILQYLSDGDLIFNSIVGPMRVHYGH